MNLKERQIGLRGEQERLSEARRGQEQRAGIRTTGEQQRISDLQREMFRRYKENRDFEQARGSYRV